MPVGLVGTALTSGLASGLGATALASLPGWLGAAGVLETGLIGAGVGAGSSALFGKDPLTGALTGGLGGAANVAAPLLGDALGLGTTGLEGILPYALTNAASGAAGAAIGGGDLGKGALFGAGTGILQGGLSQILNPGQAAPAASGGAGGTSQAAATAVSQGGIPDLTAPSPGGLGSGAGAISVSDLGPGPASGGGASGGSGVFNASSLVPPGGIDTINVTGNRIPTSDLNLISPAAGGAPSASAAGSQQSRDPLAGGGQSTPGQFTPLNGGTTAAPKTSVGKFLDDPSISNFGGVLASNPAALVGAGGLAYQALNQPSKPDQSALTGKLSSQADALASEGAAFRNYVNTGRLPPGAEASVNAAATAAKAHLKSVYAGMGLTGSTSEATALAQVDQQVVSQTFEIANNLLQTGIKESGMSADLYKALLGDSETQDKEMSDSIANFAAAIAGGGNRGGINVNLGGAKAA